MSHGNQSIFFVRHGETACNAARMLQMPDTPLSEQGRQQAARLATRLADAGITRIISSDYPRAMTTAQAVAAVTGLTVETNAGLRERDFGDLRGQAYDALPRSAFGLDSTPPNGESGAQFLARVATAWRAITAAAETGDGNILVVTHGLVCRAFYEYHVHDPARGSTPGMWLNTSVTEVLATPPWTVRRVNCVAHLTD